MMNSSIWFSEGNVSDDIIIACQGVFTRSSVFNGVFPSLSSFVFFQIGLLLLIYRITRFLLKPLNMSYASHLIAGILVGILFGVFIGKQRSTSAQLLSVGSILSNLGFNLHIFMLGVEINFYKLRKTSQKPFIIAYSSVVVSAILSIATYWATKDNISRDIDSIGFSEILLVNATNYLVNTSSHINDLGISNSKLGHLLAKSSMVVDLSTLGIVFVIVNIIIPISKGGASVLQCLVIFYYVLILMVIRPLIIHIVSLTPEGKPMKQVHFVSIIMIVLVLATVGENLAQKFSPFLLALTLPEEPLATIFSQKLDTFAYDILYPFYVVWRGMNMTLHLERKLSEGVILILVTGYAGKFCGSFISAWFLNIPFAQSITLSLVMSARGVLDIALLQDSLDKKYVNKTVYTICVIHALFTMGILLPLARFFYKPSSQYSTIERHSVIDFQVNNDTLMLLACIHKEDNLPGLMHLLKVSQSTAATPVSVIALQLFQLTGRCAMPIMAPLHEISDISTFRTNIDRCNRILNSFLSLERESGGRTRAQHYVATSPYSTMHNDICNLSHEKKVGLIILPFHICWDIDGTIIDSSLYVREVNNMVLDKAPCSVGILVDRRSQSKQHVIDEEVYLISVIFVGGADDYEALAYAKVCANLPNVRLDVVWLKSPVGKEENKLDYEVLKNFRRSCMNNERITFKEVVVSNGAETIQVVMAIKDQVDLLITGKHHNINFIPMLGLSKGWSEYPELGILGDIFACFDFRFSILIVQQEPQVNYSLDLQLNYINNCNFVVEDPIK